MRRFTVLVRAAVGEARGVFGLPYLSHPPLPTPLRSDCPGAPRVDCWQLLLLFLPEYRRCPPTPTPGLWRTAATGADAKGNLGSRDRAEFGSQVAALELRRAGRLSAAAAAAAKTRFWCPMASLPAGPPTTFSTVTRESTCVSKPRNLRLHAH